MCLINKFLHSKKIKIFLIKKTLVEKNGSYQFSSTLNLFLIF